MSPTYRAGFIALVGPPNAGKSTFLNKVLGEKIAIVSPKPQTTRTSITGIHTTAEEQIIFLDTPGVHTARGKLNRFLVDAAWGALQEANGVILFLDGSRYAGNEKALERDLRPLAARIGSLGVPMAVALNKVDQIKPKERLLGLLADCAERWPGVELVPISARTGVGVDALLAVIRNFLPLSPALFPEDQLSTASVRFMASEIIREKLFLALDQELPYNVAVEIETWEELPEQNMTMIGAMIYTSKNSHKGMIVGKQGQNLKVVGQQARQELKTLLGTKVHLELWVKVREGWTEDGQFMTSLGLGS
ncbi:GTP-binding protein Era [Desulfomicrobium macestii]|uniref:GTPase Era n=2 Tax=Desulfomicrobium TaxID=898 RepID=A0A8G2C1V8_DESNO|nr:MULTISPECIES: GTPase Era [Desulfomicrobium]MBE1425153.1 GTP-binding protein Era [Desulfomicrobium macestii]SFL55486.1 GTP-binding protein Era [Desulfomicrobium norvegicum]